MKSNYFYTITNGLTSATTVTIGDGLSGGVGAKLGGGNFWEGERGCLRHGVSHVRSETKQSPRQSDPGSLEERYAESAHPTRVLQRESQGLITSGLNHAAHSGLLGEGFAVALVTQRFRHIISPDAIHYAVGGEVGVAPLIEIKLGKILMLRGDQAGSLENLWEFAIGGGLDMGVSGEATNLYYNGPVGLVDVSRFTGYRVQGLVGVSVGVEVTGSVSFSAINEREFVLGVGRGIGYGLGVSPMPGVGLSGNLTYGYSFIPQF